MLITIINFHSLAIILIHALQGRIAQNNSTAGFVTQSAAIR